MCKQHQPGHMGVIFLPLLFYSFLFLFLDPHALLFFFVFIWTLMLFYKSLLFFYLFSFDFPLFCFNFPLSTPDRIKDTKQRIGQKGVSLAFVL